MKISSQYIAPWLAAAGIVAAIAPWLAAAGIVAAIGVAPSANAATDPCTPYGTESIGSCLWTDSGQDTQQTGTPF